jgi:hypothetical protein
LQSEWRKETVSHGPGVVTCNCWRPTAFENTEAEYCNFPIWQVVLDIAVVFVCGGWWKVDDTNHIMVGGSAFSRTTLVSFAV